MKRWILNIFLAGVVFFFGGRIYGIWTQPSPPMRQRPQTVAHPPFPAVTPPVAHRAPPRSHYAPVISQNLFSRERGRITETGPVVNSKTVEESRFAKTIALYGTLIREDRRTALVSAGAGTRAGTELSWVQVGDKVNQVTVVGIEADRIYVREGASTFEIRLDDRDHPSKRAPLAQRAPGPTLITSTARPVSSETRGAPPPVAQAPASATRSDGSTPNPKKD